jgi:hypothetical protein
VTYALLATDWLLFIVASWIAALAGGRIKRAFKGAATAGTGPGSRDYARIKQTAWTARLTLAVPAAAFLIVTISIWAGIWIAVAGTPEKTVNAPPATSSSVEAPTASVSFCEDHALTVRLLKDIVERVEPRWNARVTKESAKHGVGVHHDGGRSQLAT